MHLEILLISMFCILPFAGCTKTTGPFDVVVLCDESKHMYLSDAGYNYKNFASFLKKFLPQPINFYGVVGCRHQKNLRLNRYDDPFITISSKCRATDDYANERNYDKCLLKASDDSAFVVNQNRPNVSDVIFIIGDGDVESDTNTASMAAIAREYADIFYFYPSYVIRNIGVKNFYNRQFHVLANITADQDKVLLFNENKFDELFDRFVLAACYRKISSGACYVDHSKSDWKCVRRVKKQQEKPQGNFLCPEKNILETFEKCVESECHCDDLYPWETVAECSATDCETPGEVISVRNVSFHSMCPSTKHDVCYPLSC